MRRGRSHQIGELVPEGELTAGSGEATRALTEGGEGIVFGATKVSLFVLGRRQNERK